MDDLFNKAKEMAQDPANQERIKKMAQERFGGGSRDANQSEGASGDQSSEQSQESAPYAEEGMSDTSSADQSTSYDSNEGNQTEGESLGSRGESGTSY